MLAGTGRKEMEEAKETPFPSIFPYFLSQTAILAALVLVDGN